MTVILELKEKTSSQNTSNVIGDVNLEYKITDDGRFRIKAFNRTNNLPIIENNAPYTQGIGIFYRREFDHFLSSSNHPEKLLNQIIKI